MEKLFFPTKIEARREHARIGLINKERRYPQLNQSDLLNEPRSQANSEAKHGRFELDPYRG